MGRITSEESGSNTQRDVATKKSPRKDVVARQKKLIEFIERVICNNPCEMDGHKWAGPLSMARLSKITGIPPGSLGRYLKEPIVKTARGHGAQKALYLRLGKADAPRQDAAQRKIANTMQKIWCELHDTERVTRNDWGKLFGLARDFPDGWQVKIFEHTIKNWEEFAAAANAFIVTEKGIRERGLRKHPIEGLPANAVNGPYAIYDDHDYIAQDLHGERLMLRAWRHPNIGFLRRFHKVASKVYRHHRQDTGESTFPEEVWWA